MHRSWSELTPVLANVFLGLPVPLSSFQMIYICVITDVFPSLSLIYEKPESDIMRRPPKKKAKAKLVYWKLLVQAYLVTGNLETFFAFLSYFMYMDWYGGISPSELFLAYPSPPPPLSLPLRSPLFLLFFFLFFDLYALSINGGRDT